MLDFKIRDAQFGVFGSPRSLLRTGLLALLLAIAIAASGMSYVAFAEWNLSSPRRDIIPYALAGIVLSAITVIAARIRGPAQIRDVLWASLDLKAE